MGMRSVVPILSALLLVLAGCGAGAAAVRPSGDTYEVVLVRPARAGDRARVEIVVTEETEKTEKPDGKKERGIVKAELHGMLQVLEVDEAGRPTRRKVMVEKLTLEADGETFPVLPEGAIVHVMEPQGPDDSPYAVENVEIAADATDSLINVLALVLPLRDPTDGFDRFFSTEDRQTIGASWPVPSALVESLSDASIEVDATQFEGKTTLKGTCELFGISCLEFGIELHFGHFAPAVPATATVNHGTRAITIERSCPLDTSKPALHDTTVVTDDLSITELSRSGEITVEVHQKRTYDLRRQPL